VDTTGTTRPTNDPASDEPAAARTGALLVLRSPGAARALAASLVGRLPLGMVPLGLLLFARGNRHTLAAAGALVGVYVGAMALGAPALARAVDRYRQPPVLLCSVALSTTGFLLVAAAGSAAFRVAVVGAALAGVGSPPLEACLRALWPDVLGPRLVHAGYALDVAAQELIFVTGPVITLAAVAAGGPAAGLLAAAALQLAGTLVFATSPAARRWRGEAAPRHWAGPLRRPRLVLLLAGVVLVGAAVGSVTVAVTAHAESVATRSAAGWLLAAQALGALVGGLLYARWPGEQRRRLPVIAAALTVGYVPLLLTPGIGATAGLMTLSGVALPPLLTAVFVVVDGLAPAGTATEAFAWVATGFAVGSAGGSALDGMLVDGFGVRAGFVLAPVAAALATAVLGRVAAAPAAARGARAP
jgi:predicted MFS family arabinose efflux permease